MGRQDNRLPAPRFPVVLACCPSVDAEPRKDSTILLMQVMHCRDTAFYACGVESYQIILMCRLAMEETPWHPLTHLLALNLMAVYCRSCRLRHRRWDATLEKWAAWVGVPASPLSFLGQQITHCGCGTMRTGAHEQQFQVNHGSCCGSLCNVGLPAVQLTNAQ